MTISIWICYNGRGFLCGTHSANFNYTGLYGADFNYAEIMALTVIVRNSRRRF